MANIRTKAVRDGDHYVISGQKQWISYANVANLICVFAKTGDVNRRGYDNISTFMVEGGTPGVRISETERLMGLGGVPNCQVFFDDVRVPVENLIGVEGRGFLQAMTLVDYNRPTIAACAVGVAQGAFEAALAYAKEREAFGKPIGQFQSIQHVLADMAIQIEAARCLLYETTRLVRHGDRSRMALMASMSKCFASDTAMRVTTDAVQIFGGAGYSKDYPVERMMRDAKITQIFEGTNQIQRNVIAKNLLK